MAAADLALFEIEGDRLIPTVHCYALKDLYAIIETYGKPVAIEVYKYLYYMCSHNAKNNPYFDAPEHEKEELILSQLDCSAWSSEDDEVQTGLALCKHLFNTPTSRMYFGFKVMLDNLAETMSNTPITTGRDGSLTALVNAAKNYDGLRQSFKGTYKDLLDEQQSSARGGATLAYDQQK